MTSRIPINLASYPVERVRTVRRVVRSIAGVLLLLTVVHGLFLGWMRWQSPDVGVAIRPGIEPDQIVAWTAEVEALAAAADVERARATATAVELGNELVGWRTIPWRSIFADVEGLLPQRVRLEIVAPSVGPAGEIQVQMTAAARDTGPLQDLMIALEEHASFADVWPQREDSGTDEFTRLTLRARYVPQESGE
jgi:hypothetical protein